MDYARANAAKAEKSSKSVQCAITGRCLCMRHKPSA